MDMLQFWQLTDSTRGMPDRADHLAEALRALPPAEIIEYRLRYDDALHTANRVDLWGAAHQINGGCTDDGFYDFREGLIELGREVFDRAVEDPDSLANVARVGEPIIGTDHLGDAAVDAWMAVAGRSQDDFYEEVDNADTRSDRGDVEEGEWWNFADKAEVRHRFPRLAEKFLKDEV